MPLIGLCKWLLGFLCTYVNIGISQRCFPAFAQRQLGLANRNPSRQGVTVEDEIKVKLEGNLDCDLSFQANQTKQLLLFCYLETPDGPTVK